MNLRHLEAPSWVEIEQMVCKEINVSDFTADFTYPIWSTHDNLQNKTMLHFSIWNFKTNSSSWKVYTAQELCPIPEPNEQK